jgi:HEXXH motif-containing protein
VLSLRELTRCAEATCDKYTLRLQPEAFALPGAQLATDPEWAGQELQAKHVDVVERALRLISRYASHRFEQLSATMQLIALQPRSLTAVGSSSRSYFPGASVIGLVENPYELAASLIRELFHNRLFFIAEQADLFSVSHPSKVLFREMYMQVPVVEYWLAVAAEHAAGESAHVQAVDRAFGGICALELATRELSSFKGFSDFGAKLYEVMSTNLILFSEQISAYRPSQTPN